TILSYWELLLSRMPVVRSIYKGTKQIFHTAFSQDSATFEKVGLIEYPRKGVHVVVFIARELDSEEIGLEAGARMLACFMPTTPNPTSGFLFFAHVEDVRILDLSVEDGAKLVISAGLVTPKGQPSKGTPPEIDEEIIAELTRQKAMKKTAAKPLKKTVRKRKVSPRKAT
ncbi:MAG: DUF502 domain-containing protein, partial [Aestuariivirgaceae bacterium]